MCSAWVGLCAAAAVHDDKSRQQPPSKWLTCNFAAHFLPLCFASPFYLSFFFMTVFFLTAMPGRIHRISSDLRNKLPRAWLVLGCRPPGNTYRCCQLFRTRLLSQLGMQVWTSHGQPSSSKCTRQTASKRVAHLRFRCSFLACLCIPLFICLFL